MGFHIFALCNYFAKFTQNGFVFANEADFFFNDFVNQCDEFIALRIGRLIVIGDDLLIIGDLLHDAGRIQNDIGLDPDYIAQQFTSPDGTSLLVGIGKRDQERFDDIAHEATHIVVVILFVAESAITKLCHDLRVRIVADRTQDDLSNVCLVHAIVVPLPLQCFLD